MAKVMAVEHIWAGEGSEANIELHWGFVIHEDNILLATLMRRRRLTCTLEDTEVLLVDVEWVVPTTALDRDIPDLKRVELRPEQWNSWVPNLVIDGPHSTLFTKDESAGSNNSIQFDCRQWT